jgi:hypothetical protein
MNPDPTTKRDDEAYEVEVVDTHTEEPGETDAETRNIRKEGDPIGDNFA